MTDEIDDDDILEAELADDALEKTMKKAESDAARILKQSSELLKSVSKEKEQPAEEAKPEDAEEDTGEE